MADGARTAFFDCFSGASGDMILAALLGAGLDLDLLRGELAKLPLQGFRLESRQVVRQGMAGTQVRVEAHGSVAPERRLADIVGLLEGSSLSEWVRSRAVAVFERLATADAAVHGIGSDQVHFHEVGAVDAIVDVVGSVAALDLLGIERVHASALPLARGMVTTSHGALPLPAPATLALIARARAPTRPVDLDAELVTPTGAAILTTLAEFSQPAMSIEGLGVGFGARELPWPNILRVWIGVTSDSDLETGDAVLIETNLDDCSPEQAGFAMERLFEAGALDAFFTPVYMKKNRPAIVLSVLATPAQADTLARTILRETTSLGVRFRRVQRLMCPRRVETLATAFGPLHVKVKTIDGQDAVCPEYEECARVARERKRPIGEVYAAVYAAARDSGLATGSAS